MTYKDKPFMCISLKELPVSERPREKMIEKGPDYMSNLDLMCILLGSGTQGIRVQDAAQEALDYLTSAGADYISIKGLEKIGGIGSAKAITIVSALELGRRLCSKFRRTCKSPADIWEAIKHYDDSKQEHLICVMLNGALEILDKEVITTGLINRTVVHPREVYAPAIEKRATSIIIAHNHPSGNLSPSPDDMEVTSRIKKAGDVLGISLLDHIIFSIDNFHSLAESGEFYFESTM